MKLRQAKKIVTNGERGCRVDYRRSTSARAHETWDRADKRGATKFQRWLKRLIGPRRYLELSIESSLEVLEQQYAR